jgi:hypothetical protein
MFMPTAIKPVSLLCLLCLLVPASMANGQDARDKKKKREMNVDFSPGWGGCYRPREWTPITVGITTPFEKPVDCMVGLSAAQDSLNSLEISRREALMPGQPKEIPLVARLDYGVNAATLTITGTDTPLFWSHTYDLWDRSGEYRLLTAVNHWETLIGVTGSQGFSITQVQQASVSRRQTRRGAKQGKVYTRYRFQRLLPSDWTGYASLDLLVLYDPEWVDLTNHQQRAIAQYVSNGGSVLMVLGTKPLPAGSLLARMLPLGLGDPKEIRLAARDLSDWKCDERKTDKVACWQAALGANAHGWNVEHDRNGNAIFASGPVGFGRAGVLLFDPALLGCPESSDLANFWVPRMATLVDRRQITLDDNQANADNDYSYDLGPESMASKSVLEYLYSVEQLKPIHIGWVVLVLASLAVLIGPVDYLVLKAAGRLTWTWVTSTACIAVFSVGAYYGVEYLRSGELQARLVSVEDAVDGADCAWSTRHLGIFAPHSDDYRLANVDADHEQWWAGIAPDPSDSINRYSEQVTSRRIYCQQHIDGGSVPVSVPINIWSMQSLLCESRLAKAPFAATAARAPNGEWTVTVKNPGPAPISRCYARVDPRQAVRCGSVPAGQTREFTARAEAWQPQGGQTPDVPSGDHRYDDGREYQGPFDLSRCKNDAPLAQGASRRTAAIESYLKDGAVVVCAEYDNAPAPFGIEGKDCRFQHTLLARLVVFPQGRE